MTDFIININYDTNKKLKISDHRPVFASFRVNLNQKYSHNSIDMDIDMTGSIIDTTKMNAIIRKLSTYYHFLVFSYVVFVPNQQFGEVFVYVHQE